MFGRSLGGWLAISALTIAVLTACGVPIAAYELTPTPENQPGIQILPISSSLAAKPATTAVSSIAALPANATPIPTATRAATPATATLTTTPPSTTATAGPAGALTASASPTGTPATPTPTSPPLNGNLPADALKAVNDSRTSHGLSALRLNANLNGAAAAYASLMADKMWFTCICDPHMGPDGSTPARREADGGYGGLFRGETLAAGQSNGGAAVNAWLASPSHAAIILDPTAVDVGIGYAYNAADPYRHYWVLETGIP